ncbi:DUF349 domain-containing protein [Rufibacter latericius]|uniref:DUF349 domain-containing protein n=1 Tax=Rufibacter latericius TaxID=2487040 RepID=A0A3M9MYU8_9BACT|nr:DUF349 domain-containing protein [Rufibacter latericius]RNI30660.1 DUF349 domain-containing protein [Rufibacter latericius]
MINLNPEDQQNGRTDTQSPQEQSTNDQNLDPRRILEDRIAEINAQNGTPATTVDTIEQVPSSESTTADAGAEVAAPQVEPEVTQSSVLVSNEAITDPIPDSTQNPVPNTEETITSELGTIEMETEATPDASASTPVSTQGEIPSFATAEVPAEPVAQEEHHAEEEELHLEEDYSHLTVDELRGKIMALAQEGNVRKSGRALNTLYRLYEPHFQEERQDALNRFIAEGGSPDDFDYNAPKAHKDVEQAMQRFREARFKEQRQEEEQKTQNLQKKRDLLERLRVLIESETQTSGNAIKELQTEWKSIGQVPNAEAQQLWNSYHALLDMYYNNRSIFFELKELDRKRNLDAKNALCERAEGLAKEENINKALQELRHLHDEWKHIGPIPNEVRDQVWNRFIQASEQVHERKKQFFESRRNEELANLEKKRELLAQIEQFQHFTSDRINDWRDKTDQIQQLKENWDSAGLVPKENAEEVNKAFWSSYKAFFHHKNTFFKALDEEKMQNYRQKVALCEEAESHQNSEEWDSTKEKLIQLQKKWKTIGRVPDKYSDKIWNRFRTACNAFFDRLHQEAQNKESQQNQLSAQKQTYCEQLATKVADPTFLGSLEEFNQIHQEWQSFSNEGKRNPKVEDRFQQLLAKYLDKVPEMSPQQKEQTLFQLQLNHLKASPDGDQKLYQKEQHLRRDITSLENDISTLRTNIEFFARSKNAEKLREEYQSKIDDAQNRIQHLKRQLKALRS